jgi:PAS domain S-box-containing protein
MDAPLLIGKRYHLAIIFLIGVIFLSDWYLGHKAAVPVLFVAPILVTLFLHGTRHVTYYVVLCTLLSLSSFLFSEKEPTNILNALISIGGIWSSYYFIIRFKKATEIESRIRERLNALFEHATEGIVISNNKGEMLMVNPKAESQFGYEKGELIGKRIEILIPQRLSERHVKHREHYAKNPYPRPMGKGTQLYAKRKDNSEFPVEISLSNFSTSEGMFVIAFVIDISERKKAEELLRKEKEIAQMYLDIAPVIFLVLRQDLTVGLINQNGCRMLGYSEAEIIGRNWFENFVGLPFRDEAKANFKRVMEGKGGAPSQYEYEISTRNGEKRLIAWKNTIIRDERGHPVATLNSGEDITEMRKQEEMLIKVNRELKQYSDEVVQLNADLEKRVHERTDELATLITKLEKTNVELAGEVKERRLAEIQLEKKREELRTALEKEKELSELKSRFVTMASHEFRTPLSTILSSASLIARYNEPGQDEKRFKHVDRIKSSVNNLTGILNDFLSLGKLEEGKIQCTPSEFNLVSFSGDIIGEMKELTKHGQFITHKHHGETENVFLDKNLTRNICFNLISNAIKYSSEGKEIVLSTTARDQNVLIEVTDQGIGIPEDEQQHVFERFFRANNATNIQGTGLGLNIVKKYAELMGGSVAFRSVYRQGSTFSVTLPSVITIQSQTSD